MSNELVKRVTGGNGAFRLTGNMGWRIHPVTGAKNDYHTGNDYGVPVGTKIYMPYNGKVVYADNLGGYGLCIETTPFENDKRLTLLAHLSKVYVKAGEYVKQGTLIGLTGNTGNSTGPHLHLADGEFQDGSKARPYFDQSANGKVMEWQNPTGTRYWDKPENFEKEKNKYLGIKPNDKPKPNPKPNDKFNPETGYSLKTKMAMNIRTEPSVKSEVVRVVPKGTVLEYEAWGINGGYDWKRLTDGNYIACGTDKDNQYYCEIIPTPKKDKIEVGSNVIYNGYAYTQSTGGKKGKLNNKNAKGLIDKINNGDRPYHVKGVGWFKLSDLNKA